MKRYIFVLLGLAYFVFWTATSFAVPYAEIELKAKHNHDGTYTYKLTLENQGPVLSNVATPPSHIINTMFGGIYNAGGKLLNQDDNVVLFGLDTGRDDISISKITDGESHLHGSVESGWADSDGDGTANQVVAWHPPFGFWPEGTAITHGQSITVSFVADVKLDKVLIWIGGSDDDVIWVDGHDMGEDVFGIYDATDGEYLSTFFQRHVHVEHKRRHHKHQHD